MSRLRRRHDIARTPHVGSPADTGSAFDLTPRRLAPLEPYRAYLTIVPHRLP